MYFISIDRKSISIMNFDGVFHIESNLEVLETRYGIPHSNISTKRSSSGSAPLARQMWVCGSRYMTNAPSETVEEINRAKSELEDVIHTQKNKLNDIGTSFNENAKKQAGHHQNELKEAKDILAGLATASLHVIAEETSPMVTDALGPERGAFDFNRKIVNFHRKFMKIIIAE